MYYKSTVYVSTFDDRSDRKVCVREIVCQLLTIPFHVIKTSTLCFVYTACFVG